MSILETNILDGVALTDDGQGLSLLITDHLDWGDEYRHLVLLQDKINAYIAYCEGGQYKKTYPDAVIRYGIIELHCLHEPTATAMEFLKQTQAQVTELGLTIRCHIS